MLDVAALHDVDAAAPGLLQPLEDLVLDLQVPGVVELSGLQDGPGRRGGVTAALHLDGVEEGPVGHMVARVQLAADDVARLEVDEPVGPGADRLEVARRFPRLGALERLEEVLGQDHAAHAHERIGPERRRLGERHLDRVAVDLVDLEVLVGADGVGRGGRVGRVLPGEDAVVGRERLAVVPRHALLELPGDGPAVLADAAVLHARDLGGQGGGEIAVGVPRGQRLVEDARAVLVLGAHRDVGVEQGGALPPQRLQRATAAALGRLVDQLRRLGLGHAGRGEHLARQRRGQPEPDHRLDEAPAAQPAALHLVDQRPQRALVHEVLPQRRVTVPTGGDSL